VSCFFNELISLISELFEFWEKFLSVDFVRTPTYKWKIWIVKYVSGLWKVSVDYVSYGWIVKYVSGLWKVSVDCVSSGWIVKALVDCTCESLGGLYMWKPCFDCDCNLETTSISCPVQNLGFDMQVYPIYLQLCVPL